MAQHVLISRAQADALAERASALEQRALFLSCAEADQLEQAAGVLVAGVAAGGAHERGSLADHAGAARKRSSKRKHASVDTGAAA